MSRRPSNWYGMSETERSAWTKCNREREDLEYEKDREQEARERSERNEARLKRSLAEARSDYENEREEMGAELVASELARKQLVRACQDLLMVWDLGKPVPHDAAMVAVLRNAMNAQP